MPISIHYTVLLMVSDHTTKRGIQFSVTEDDMKQYLEQAVREVEMQRIIMIHTSNRQVMRHT
jgi:hypothetical protein